MPERAGPTSDVDPDLGMVADGGPTPDSRIAADGAPHTDVGHDAGLPGDSMPVDSAATDAAPIDATPDVAIPVDAGMVDSGLPPDECLPLVDGPHDDTLPCLRVRPAADPGEPFLHAASATVLSGPLEPRVFVSGGLDPVTGQAIDRVRVYDPDRDAWSDGPPLPQGEARWGHGMVRIEGDVLVIAGGAGDVGPNGGWTGLRGTLRTTLGEGGWIPSVSPMRPGRSDGVFRAARGGVSALYAGGRTIDGGGPSAAVDAVDAVDVRADRAMRTPRIQPSAEMLDDGSLLVVGGFGEAGPATETVDWLDGDVVLADRLKVHAPRGNGASAALPDGALFVGGAATAGGAPTPSASRFQSDIGRLVPLPDMHISRIAATVNAIGPDGEGWRLVVGGRTPADARPGVVEVFDPANDRFLAFALPPPWDRHRFDHTAASFERDGSMHVLVVGGRDSEAQGAGADAMRAPLRFRLEPPAVVTPPLPGGCLAPLFGGARPNTPCVTVRRGPSLDPRAYAGATVADDGTVVISGGRDPESDAVLRSTRIMYFGGRGWLEGPSLNMARWGHSMADSSSVGEVSVLAIGGAAEFDAGVYLATRTIEQLVPGGASWLLLPSLLTAGRVHHATLDYAGATTLVGGRSGSDHDTGLASTDLINDGQQEAGPVLFQSRSQHVACLLGNEGVLVYGGRNRGGAIGLPERFDPDLGTWQPEPDEGLPRMKAACIGGEGRAEILGGAVVAGGMPTATWQRYDSADGGSIRHVGVPQMARARLDPTIERIGGSDVQARWYLVVGGETAQSGEPVVEIVDPDAEEIFAFRLPAAVSRARFGHQAVMRVSSRLIRDGAEVLVREVIVMGGVDADTDEPITDVLIFEAIGRDRIGEELGPQDAAP